MWRLAGSTPYAADLAERLRTRRGNLREVLFDLYDEDERRRMTGI